MHVLRASSPNLRIARPGVADGGHRSARVRAAEIATLVVRYVLSFGPAEFGATRVRRNVERAGAVSKELESADHREAIAGTIADASASYRSLAEVRVPRGRSHLGPALPRELTVGAGYTYPHFGRGVKQELRFLSLSAPIRDGG